MLRGREETKHPDIDFLAMITPKTLTILLLEKKLGYKVMEKAKFEFQN